MNRLKSVQAFAGHIFEVTVIFVVIAIPAVALDLVVKWLEGMGTGTLILYGLRFVEYLLFLSDVTICVVFIGQSTVKLVQEIWRGIQ